MLERASSSVECTAQILLRNIERPSRSHRVLGLNFWKNAGDYLEVPIWWPTYLQNVRDKVDGRRSSRDGSTTLRSTACKSHRLQCPQNPRQAGHLPGIERQMKGRTFAYAAHSNQTGLPAVETREESRIYDAFDSLDADQEEGNDERNTTQIHQTAHGDQRLSKAKNVKRNLHTNGTENNYQNAWALFVQSGHKQEVAPKMLHYLAASTSRSDLRHALTVFDFIPTKERTESDYEIVLDVAIKCQNFKTAIHLVLEALSKGIGKNTYFKLMAHCVQKKLWNTLAGMWKAVGISGQKANRTRQGSRQPRSPNMAGKYAFHFDNIDKFPAKIISLAERLSRSDAVLAANSTVLAEICKRLAYIAAESPRVMATISGKRALALFAVQEQLGFDSKLHLAAIGTIRRMQEKGSKSQLAMLIYRNYSFANPDVEIPRWVYGALIGICAEARAPPYTYEFLLEEMAKHHGYADNWSYQQVLAACARQGEVEAVFKMFTEFRQRSTITNLREVNHLLNVFAVTGDSEGTQRQFDRLKPDFGLTPDVVSWTLLLLSHARSSHSVKAFEIFRQMKQAGVKPNAVSWSILINVAASRADTTKARQIYDSAIQEGVPESAYMLGPIVESLLRNNETQEAEDLVISSSRDSSEQTPIRLWNSLFRHYAFKSDSDAIHRLQGLMKAMNIAPDAMTYAALMTALVVKGQTSDAIKVVRALHSSQQLNPSEFHYSILIHGFVQERNSHMATVLYHEMLEHFPRPSASAKLAMLHMRLQHEEQSMKKRLQRQAESSKKGSPKEFMPEQSLQLLAEMLMEDSRVDAASNVPSPGFRRQASRTGVEAVFLGSLISFLQRNQAHSASEGLLETTQALSSKSNLSPVITIANLALKLSHAIENSRWAEADDTWQNILDTARGSFGVIDYDTRSKETKPVPEKTISETLKRPRSTNFLDGPENFRSMLPFSIIANEAPYVLEAHKFALSRPLSLYLQALDIQCRHHDAVLLVNKIQATGFSLSGRNWNRYVQILSKSPEFDHRVLAFKIFQKYLLPNAPHWNIIRRGKWISPQSKRSDHSTRAKPEVRSRLERNHPALLMPSYFTMVHLAMALMKAHRSMVAGDALEKNAIQNAAPETVDLVREVPYLADRVQGLLLRDRRVIGDMTPRARAHTQPEDHIGIRGPRSIFDQLPVSVLEDVERLLTPTNSVRDSLHKTPRPDPQVPSPRNVRSRYVEHIQRQEARCGAIAREPQYIEKLNRLERPDETRDRVTSEESVLLKPLLDLAEQIMGQLHCTPQILPGKGRMETEAELQQRLKLQTVQRLDMVDQLRQELGNPSTLDDVNWGEAFKTFVPQDNDAATTDVDLRSFITDFMATPGERAVQSLLKHRSVIGTSGDNQAQMANTDEGLARQQKPETHVTPQQQSKTLRQASPARSDLISNPPNIDTSALKRRISARYKYDNSTVFTGAELPRRGPWSINKALRRQKLQEKQEQARLRRKLIKEHSAKRDRRPRRKDNDEVQDYATRFGSAFGSYMSQVSQGVR